MSKSTGQSQGQRIDRPAHRLGRHCAPSSSVCVYENEKREKHEDWNMRQLDVKKKSLTFKTKSSKSTYLLLCRLCEKRLFQSVSLHITLARLVKFYNESRTTRSQMTEAYFWCILIFFSTYKISGIAIDNIFIFNSRVESNRYDLWSIYCERSVFQFH